MKNGCTLEEVIEFKSDSTNVRTCKKCLIEKHIKHFCSKKAINGLFYTEHTCNSCKYKMKITTHADMLSTYTARQISKENFTIEGRASMLRNRCRERAKKYNLEFSISKEYLINLLTPLKCMKTGVDLVLDDLKYDPYKPSIDRIDSNLGYTEDNIQVTCMIYNFCKNGFTEEQVEDFFNKIKH